MCVLCWPKLLDDFKVNCVREFSLLFVIVCCVLIGLPLLYLVGLVIYLFGCLKWVC